MQVFKNNTSLGNNFLFKNWILHVVYKFQCGLCNDPHCGEYVRHLNARIGKNIGISPLT